MQKNCNMAYVFSYVIKFNWKFENIPYLIMCLRPCIVLHKLPYAAFAYHNLPYLTLLHIANLILR